VRHEIRALQKRLGITAIHVTHDREEAMVMADRIIILDKGRIAQQGTPEEVYNRPASAFVAAFMGAENHLSLSGYPDEDRFQIAQGPTNEASFVPLMGRPINGIVEARFRAEAVQILSINEKHVPAGGLKLSGQVVAVTYPGGHWRHVIRVGDHEILADSTRAFDLGETVNAYVAPEALFLFNQSDSTPTPSLPRQKAREMQA
jgi:ABC-type Fe3+/spermidine/putrescine transport system ATPase subunit